MSSPPRPTFLAEQRDLAVEEQRQVSRSERKIAALATGYKFTVLFRGNEKMVVIVGKLLFYNGSSTALH